MPCPADCRSGSFLSREYRLSDARRKKYVPKFNALLIMKNLWLILAVGFAAFSCSGAPQAQEPTRVDSILRKLYDPNTSSVVVVAHRGDWKHSVENSLPAMRHAIEMGVDVVEIDIRRTADGRLVLMHDATIDRTTNGRGEVASLTFDSIRRCRAKRCRERASSLFGT